MCYCFPMCALCCAGLCPSLFCPQALAIAKSMAPLNQNAEAALQEVWDCWLTALQQEPQPDSFAALHQQLVEQGQLQEWPRPCVWSALKVVLGMLQVCMPV